MSNETNAIVAVLDRASAQVHSGWLQEAQADTPQAGRAGAARQTSELLAAVDSGLRGGGMVDDLESTCWKPLRDGLEALSRDRAAQGRSAAETSRFVRAFKRPVFAGLQVDLRSDAPLLASSLWALSTLGDAMSEWTISTYQHSREEVIERQQRELLELSTPVIRLWDGVLAVPMIGTLDSARTQLVMETLLQEIARSGAKVAIIDITGVPTVDTLVARHLMQTVAAIRLMGADCIISGVRPQIAQTIVHLGIDLNGIPTKSNLADALKVAFARGGFRVVQGTA
jgi:rsbT co-antagonist protein RsbR